MLINILLIKLEEMYDTTMTCTIPTFDIGWLKLCYSRLYLLILTACAFLEMKFSLRTKSKFTGLVVLYLSSSV